MHNQDIYLKILEDKADYLFELPMFVSKSSYDEREREWASKQEVGKIQTQNCTFRFIAENFKIEIGW
jgi:hypothetical protein